MSSSLLLVAIAVSAVVAAVSVTSAPAQTPAVEETTEARSLDQAQESDSEVWFLKIDFVFSYDR